VVAQSLDWENAKVVFGSFCVGRTVCFPVGDRFVAA